MKIKQIITEQAVIAIEGKRAEAVLNTVASMGVELYEVVRQDGAVHVGVSGFHIQKILDAAEQCSASARVINRRGVFHFFKRFKKRYVLIALPIILFAAVFQLSQYIWEINVSGNSKIPSAEIIEQLELLGVGVGSNGLHIDNELVRSKMQQRISGISWMTVRVNGSRAEVIIKERRPKPEMVDESMPKDIIAGKTGLVEKVSVLAGKGEVNEGDMVLKGQRLITGQLTDKQNESRNVCALGEVWARTWYETAVDVPLNHIEKNMTGRKKTKTSLKICNLRINFYFDSGISYEFYDKITKKVRPEILGIALPLAVIKTQYFEYEPMEGSLEPTKAEEIARAAVSEKVQRLSGGAEQTQKFFETAESNGVLRAVLTAECREQIGVSIPIEGAA